MGGRCAEAAPCALRHAQREIDADKETGRADLSLEGGEGVTGAESDLEDVFALSGIEQPQAGRAGPTDQAWIETLFGHIKGEWPHLEKITDPAELAAELDRVGTEYNTVRLHAGIGYVTPDDEHDGRGDGIRQARRSGLAAARLARIAAHQLPGEAR